MAANSETRFLNLHHTKLVLLSGHLALLVGCLVASAVTRAQAKYQPRFGSYDVMAERWNPGAKSPKGPVAEYMQWLRDDLLAFQRERPDVPQEDVATLGSRKFKKLLRAWNSARQEAELEEAKKISPAWYKTVKRFNRTRVLSMEPTKSAKRNTQKGHGVTE
jgi:hypothetical protein